MGDLLRQVLHQITGEPTRFIAEAAQSVLLLVGLVWAVRRYAARRLSDRRARIAAELQQAEEDERESARIRDEAGSVVEKAKAAAAELLSAAREEAAREREGRKATIDADARQVVDQARQAVVTEQEKVRRDASERLLRLTTETTRRYIEEMLTESERRALVQKAIEAFVEDLHREKVSAGAGAS